MASAMTWFLLLAYTSVASGQILRQYGNSTLENQGICISRVAPNLTCFRSFYQDCIVVIGTLQVTLFEQTDSEDFMNVTFPNLREVTEFLVVYRVIGLHSVGQLFPNLARIRGEKLLNNYALIVHDMVTLQEIGLYGLLKIDRGGVMIWGVPKACFINTVDWRNISPRSQLVISNEDTLDRCKFNCTCSRNTLVNHCWNNRKCQIYLEGPEADKCHDQCFGCRKTRFDECSLCRYFTHNGKCVSQCPSNTIILPNCQYCITNDECRKLDGWVWNNTCIFHCPLDYEEENTDNGITCKYCPTCHKTCEGLNILVVSQAQEAEGCVFINGPLEIHIRPVPEVMAELTAYLSRIQEVNDYVAIYSSMTITSLDFLSSLKRIKGHTLKNGQYSLIIHNMANLKTLFTPNVTQNLKIDRGTLKIYSNPKLCKKQIDMIRPLFPVEPNNETDVPTGMNGYGGDCEDGVSFQVRIVSETSVVVMFSTLTDPDAYYSVLYMRLQPEIENKKQNNQNLIPETCTESEWNVVNAETSFGYQFGIVELKSLRPASTYAVCIETYDPVYKILARSTISNFTTPVGKPVPPFIFMLNATSSTVTVNWTIHRDYVPFINYYILDVSLLEIYARDIAVKDQCYHFENTELDVTRHTIKKLSPPDYITDCESTCGVNEEDFNVCSSISCDGLEDEIPGNSSFGNNVRTLVLNLTNSYFQAIKVEGLAPFRDYRFRLRACTYNECSGSDREVIRTKTLAHADMPSIVHVNADDRGYLSVKWNPPEVTNGPILSYIIEVMPKIKQTPLNFPLPHVLCVLSNATSHTVKTLKAKFYSVRVCTRSMALDSTCTKWESVEVPAALPTPTWWWTGVVFAVFLYIASIAAGSMIKRRNTNSDVEPILDLSASLDESEPPSKMFSDFAPMYEIPLRDTRLE